MLLAISLWGQRCMVAHSNWILETIMQRLHHQNHPSILWFYPLKDSLSFAANTPRTRRELIESRGRHTNSRQPLVSGAFQCVTTLSPERGRFYLCFCKSAPKDNDSASQLVHPRPLVGRGKLVVKQRCFAQTFSAIAVVVFVPLRIHLKE